MSRAVSDLHFVHYTRFIKVEHNAGKTAQARGYSTDNLATKRSTVAWRAPIPSLSSISPWRRRDPYEIEGGDFVPRTSHDLTGKEFNRHLGPSGVPTRKVGPTGATGARMFQKQTTDGGPPKPNGTRLDLGGPSPPPSHTDVICDYAARNPQSVRASRM
jgi:hypothetical protein